MTCLLNHARCTACRALLVISVSSHSLQEAGLGNSSLHMRKDACLQAVSELLEQHSRQFAGSMKDILDPKKLSAGAGAPASSAEGPRAPHGSATSKWQVGVCSYRTADPRCLQA